MSILKKLDVVQGTVIKRPSKTCKTPYVADVLLNDESVLCHSPSLGCCGLCDKEHSILMTKVGNPKNVCKFRADLSIVNEPKLDTNIVVGINPKLAEELIDTCLKQNELGFLKAKTFKREQKISLITNSRFDFVGVDENDKPFVLEIKSVPLADYVDCCSKDKKKIDMSIYDSKAYNEKIAYFPDGYRKNSKTPISTRALKHLNDLQKIHESGDYRAIICYVIQREDVNCFTPSVIDKTYRDCFYESKEKGVEIHAVQFKWNEDGEATLLNDDLKILNKD